MGRKTLLGLALVFLLAAGLQMAASAQRSFWEDEALTARLSVLSDAKIIENRANDNHPPLYWLLAARWAGAFGADEWGLKSFSLLWLLLAGLLTAWLGYNLLGAGGALAGTALFALSPLALTYGHNARYYAMSAALALAAALAAERFAARRAWGWLLVYAAAAVAMLYTVYMGAAALLAANVWVLAALAGNLRKNGKTLLGWLLAQALVVLAYVPWLGALAGAVGRNAGDGLALKEMALGLAQRLGYVGAVYSVGEFVSLGSVASWLGVGLAVWLGFLALKERRAWLPLWFFGALIGASILVNLIAVYPQNAFQNLSNRTFFALPFFALLLAAGWLRQKPRARWLAGGALALIYALAAFNYFTDQQMLKPILAIPWREVMAQIGQQSGEQAVVGCAAGDSACGYYVQRYGFTLARNVADAPAETFWWLQTNLALKETSVTQDTLALLTSRYTHNQRWDYAAQDSFARYLKSRWLGGGDYEYRLQVYYFWAPLR